MYALAKETGVDYGLEYREEEISLFARIKKDLRKKKAEKLAKKLGTK